MLHSAPHLLRLIQRTETHARSTNKTIESWSPSESRTAPSQKRERRFHASIIRAPARLGGVEEAPSTSIERPPSTQRLSPAPGNREPVTENLLDNKLLLGRGLVRMS
jgi:hypothetical protein